ncbi:amino acid ABC transporter substrate-binding protein [Hahella sp. CCB-MM4]|uniref:substrate-binding periplasmic protein n=1 Tax=Hahella sp. (strain CCB-MM4) TaxID=1926491 RepID=UPI000B9BC0CC|nr:transporter substrate-binding domain-containing protein [Hahella sp. CCB-MM4]OZG70198.1 amino acid ABC transporter substrate-binding protein [Hahella sp. CCB-MM4]
MYPGVCVARLVILALLWFPIISSAEEARGNVSIAIGEWEPFISESYPHFGIIPHIISEIYKDANIEVTYGFFPWKRSYSQVKDGKWNASAIWGRTPEREQDCLYSDVVYTGEIVLFYRKEDRPITWNGNLQDLKGLSIGLPMGSAKAQPLQEAEARGLIVYDVSVDHVGIFKKLLAGRFDAVDENKAVGLYNLHTQFSNREQDMVAFTAPLESWDYHVIFSRALPDNRKYRDLFNQGLQRMKQDGRFHQMWEAFYRGDYN